MKTNSKTLLMYWSKLTFILILLLSENNLFAQPVLNWARKFSSITSGSNHLEYTQCVAVNDAGDVYSTGLYQGTSDFNPGAGTNTLIGTGHDIFISKLDISGNYVWAKKIGGADQEYSTDIELDILGNVYITGYFKGTVDFDPSSSTNNLTSSGYIDVFILKLDSDGNFVWAKTMGGASSDDISRSITIDNSSNVIITGEFSSTADFDPSIGTANLTSIGGSVDIFVCKLNVLGNFVWVKQIAGSHSNEIGAAIDVDATDNVYVAGRFTGTVDFDPGTTVSNLTHVSGANFFVLKLNSLGNFQWVRAFGIDQTIGEIELAVSPSGNAYTTGAFFHTFDYDPSSAVFNLTHTGAAGGDANQFIHKLDANGNFAWAKSFTGAMCIGRGISLDPSENVYTSGIFFSYSTSGIDFNPNAGVNNQISVAQDIQISKLNANGNYVWAAQITGSGGGTAQDIHVAATGEIYVVGSFDGIADFDPSSGVSNITTSNVTDAFVAKYAQISPLPITLVEFKADVEGRRVKTSWETLSEINNDYFTIERSENGMQYSEIGKLQGAGNSHSALDYEFYDNQPLYGLSYYRLKQTDFDGEVSYSQPVAVVRELEHSEHIYPNPANQFVVIPDGLKADIIQIMDMQGRVLFEQSNTENTILEIGHLPTGQYLISGISVTSNWVEQLMITR